MLGNGVCFTGPLSEFSSYVSVNAEVVITSAWTWHAIYLLHPPFLELGLIRDDISIHYYFKKTYEITRVAGC